MITAQQAKEFANQAESAKKELKEIEEKITKAALDGKLFISVVNISEFAKQKLIALGYKVYTFPPSPVEIKYQIIWSDNVPVTRFPLPKTHQKESPLLNETIKGGMIKQIIT